MSYRYILNPIREARIHIKTYTIKYHQTYLPPMNKINKLPYISSWLNKSSSYEHIPFHSHTHPKFHPIRPPPFLISAITPQPITGPTDGATAPHRHHRRSSDDLPPSSLPWLEIIEIPKLHSQEPRQRSTTISACGEGHRPLHPHPVAIEEEETRHLPQNCQRPFIVHPPPPRSALL
jgi:hypothetical protein